MLPRPPGNRDKMVKKYDLLLVEFLRFLSQHLAYALYKCILVDSHVRAYASQIANVDCHVNAYAYIMHVDVHVRAYSFLR